MPLQGLWHATWSYLVGVTGVTVKTRNNNGSTELQTPVYSEILTSSPDQLIPIAYLACDAPGYTCNDPIR